MQLCEAGTSHNFTTQSVGCSAAQIIAADLFIYLFDTRFANIDVVSCSPPRFELREGRQKNTGQLGARTGFLTGIEHCRTLNRTQKSHYKTAKENTALSRRAP